MNTPKLLTVDELKDLDKRWSVVLHEKDWTKQKDLLSLIGFSGNIGDIIETALAAMRVVQAAKEINCHDDDCDEGCMVDLNEALKPFQQTGEDRQTEMSILCPICGEPPLCTCQIERMNKRLVAAESDNKRLREALKKIKDIDVNEAYNTPDADYYASWRLCARTAESALEGEE